MRVLSKAALVTILVLSMVFLVLGCDAGSDEDFSSYPNKPITLIVPAAPGGSFDLTARAVSSVATEYLGMPLVVEMKPGAGTVVGSQYAKTSRPDGYTLLGAGEHAIVMRHFEDIPVNILEDFIPVARIGAWEYVLAVAGDESVNPSPIHSFDEFLAYCKDNPGQFSMSNAGPMTAAHLPILQMELELGIEFLHVPYDGGGEERMAMQSGEVDGGCGMSVWTILDARGGLLRPLATTGSERNPELPDVPTFKELGYDIDMALSWGIMVPKDTPEEIIKYLEEAIAEMVEDPSLLHVMNSMGDSPKYLNRSDFTNYLTHVDEIAAKVAESHNTN